MTSRDAAPARGGVGRSRGVGAALLGVLVLCIALQAPWIGWIQAPWFDAHQAIAPRPLGDLPVTVIEIDQKSLLALGQWPWPRTQLARLVDTVNAAGAAAIGVNILMPEPDALSPERLLSNVGANDRAVAAALDSLPSNDELLARALSSARAVLVIAGMPEITGMPLRAAPITVRNAPGADATPPAVARHAGALGNIEVLNQAAGGWGLISADPTRGVLRRIPLVASIDGTLVPTLAIEMLRVAARAPSLRLAVSGATVTAVSVGRLGVPTEADGAVRVYFATPSSERSLSAINVLDGKIDPGRLQGQLVLIGITGIGLHEYLDTPLGTRMSGSEIQAQLLENLVDGTLLHRPSWGPALEAGGLLLLGLLLLWVTPRWRPYNAAALMLGCVVLPIAVAFSVFRSERLLLDAAAPGLSLVLLFGVLLVSTLADSTRQRRVLELQVQDEREDNARIAGELEAAQRIQTSMLPRQDLLQGDRRVDLHATLTPAREVGGDLYDYFMLDEHRLFLLIGDVAGKGLSASIFMAVSKALYKSVTLRTPDADPGRIMTLANAEVSRDNAQRLFVTAFAAVLDLQSGRLSYCNAGNDNPYRLHPAQSEPGRIEDGDGPPLCAMASFVYVGASCQLRPGETLLMLTDGVTEAQNAAGELYGPARVGKALLALNRRGASARVAVDTLVSDVAVFVGGAEAADDLTILALRWHGPVSDEAAPVPG
ncbi:MAG TPA: CHASE2 domain-containing protein [Rubrivivax sp.]